MTLLDEHRLADGRKEADALIEEARQRQRRRRLLVGSIVLVVALASGIWAASGGGSAIKPPSTSKKPGHTKTPASTPGSAKKGTTTSATWPFGPWVLAIAFTTANTGFASVASDCGTLRCYVDIEATVNGGATWHQVARLARPVQPPQSRNDLWFANPEDGVLFDADSSVVLITHDGGRKWSPVRVPGVVIQAFSLGRDFVLVADECSPATPGSPDCGPGELVMVPLGADVVAAVHRLPSCAASWAGDVVSAGTTLLALGCDRLFRSENGGAKWKGIRVSFPWSSPLLAADGPSDIWVMDTFGSGGGSQWKSIYRSLNGGKTWHLAGRASAGAPMLGPSVGNLPHPGYAFMVIATSAQHVLVLSDSFGVSASFDGGRLWVSPPVARYGSEAGGMACVGSEDCWAALVDPFPHGGSVILRTRNGGRTWFATLRMGRQP